MAIQIPNPGTGNGATGDNEFVLWSKVKDNFSDQTNAASRLVGTAVGQIPLAQDVAQLSGVYSPDATMYASSGGITGDANDFEVGSKYRVSSNQVANCPTDTGSNTFLIETYPMRIPTEALLQIATVYYGRVGRYIRVKKDTTWLPWQPMTITPATYNTTTALGANVVVDEAGSFMRSTSSERYKDILAPLELDDARYADAMSLKPIIYRSTADADNPAYHYYSFSAEELGAYDPAFTLWRETETVTDEEGNVIDQPLAERQAEGININALLAMGHAIAIKQGELIKKLEKRIEILEAQQTTP